METGIKKEFKKVTLTQFDPTKSTIVPGSDNFIAENIYKPGMNQIMVKQIVKTTYPSARVTNSLSDSLFDNSDFDLEEGKSYEKTRVCWLNVPKSKSLDEIKKMIESKPNCRIWARISENVLDILTPEQIAMMDSEDVDISLDDYKEKFSIPDSDGNELGIYQQLFFSNEAKEDEDFRSSSKSASVKSKEDNLSKRTLEEAGIK
jgi:hypothetical protein